jgi:hypothetical protein
MITGDPALGEELRVPKMHGHLREWIEQALAPVENPRTRRPAGA